MIPKIIHYVWLGNDPLPEEMRKCMESWHRWMPDYQFMCWNNNDLPKVNSIFAKEACSVGKWAFASDVLRLFALYEYGGIYLDTDVDVKRSFDPLLDNAAFIGRENCLQIRGRRTEYDLTSYCLGAERGMPFIAKCLDYYRDRHFLLSKNESLPAYLRMDLRNASDVYSRIAETFGYNPGALAPERQCLDGLTVVPVSELNSYCNHLSIGSWREEPLYEEDYTIRYKFAWRIRRMVSRLLRKFDYEMIKLK